MDPAIKKVAIVLAAALIVVIGLIFVVNDSDKEKAAVVTDTNAAQTAQIPEGKQNAENQEANAQEQTAQAADAGDVSKTNEALIEDDAQAEEMYEGALAGLSEEEIAKMALAEEQGAARTEEDGTEGAVD